MNRLHSLIPLALPDARDTQLAAQALRHMRALLPSYREICGAAPYYYAEGEIQRLEHQLVRIHREGDLEYITRSIENQLTGLAKAIRSAKGRGINLDG